MNNFSWDYMMGSGASQGAFSRQQDDYEASRKRSSDTGGQNPPAGSERLPERSSVHPLDTHPRLRVNGGGLFYGPYEASAIPYPQAAAIVVGVRLRDYRTDGNHVYTVTSVGYAPRGFHPSNLGDGDRYAIYYTCWAARGIEMNDASSLRYAQWLSECEGAPLYALSSAG